VLVDGVETGEKLAPVSGPIAMTTEVPMAESTE
jgi:hypothetical protein